MKPRRVILHAGPHKTGTSSIQKVLRDQCFDAFYYPKIGQWHDGAHHNLVFSLIPELRRADAEPMDPAELLDQLQKELDQVSHETLLISSEFLSTGCATRVVDWLVSHGIADPVGMQALLVERDLLNRAASLYNQAVKDPFIGETRDPDEWLNDEAANLSLEPMLIDLQAAGAAVEVIAYEPAQSLVKRLLIAAGARQEELPDEMPWTNISISEPVLMALLEVNRALPKVEDRIKCREQILKSLSPAFTFSNPNIFLQARRV